jgi:AsmA protein
MNSIVKWLLIIGGTLIVLIIAAALIIPQLINIKQYRPIIEKQVAQATGRSFTLGEDMDISVFPWVMVKLTDLHLGNPPGFAEKDMISVKNFEIRLKFMPLLSRKIEVKTFVMDEPAIYLERLKNGKANWEGMRKDHEKAKKAASEKKSRPNKDKGKDKGQDNDPASFPIQALLVDTFSITKGKLLYIDRTKGTKKELADLNLNLDNISFEKPIFLSLDTKLDKHPITLKGHLGPIGRNPGQENIDLDLSLEAVKQVEVKIKGSLTAPLQTPGFDLNISVSPFSPIKLANSLNQPLPFTPGDSSVLKKLGLSLTAKGNSKTLSLSSGKMVLDDSTLNFSAQAKDFHLPDLKFKIKLDRINLDSYLAISDPAQTGEQKEMAATASAGSKAKKSPKS